MKNLGGAEKKIGDFNDRSVFNGFPFWEMALNNDDQPNHSDSEATQSSRALSQALGAPDWSITDLFVLVHGMNNKRDEAPGIYDAYMREIARVALEQGVDVARIGVLGIYWPSMIDLKNLDRLGAGSTLPSLKVLSGDGVSQQLIRIIEANANVRLHVAAHSLGTVVLAKALGRLASVGLGGRIGSAFLIQGAAQPEWFAPGGQLAHVADSIGGPLLISTSQQDTLMQATDLAMSAENALRTPAEAVMKLFDFFQEYTPFKPNESWPNVTWWINHGYKKYRDFFTGAGLSAPIAIHGAKGGKAVPLHRSFDDRAECGPLAYPFGAGVRGVFNLNADHAICEHNAYKVKDVAFAHLIAAGLTSSPSASRRASPYPAQALPPHAWMSQMWPALAERQLKHICLPGSHDAGTSHIVARYPLRFRDEIIGSYIRQAVDGNKYSRFADGAATKAKELVQWTANLFRKDEPIDSRSFSQTDLASSLGGLVSAIQPLADRRIDALSLTQERDIGAQLRSGARFFDLRPAVHGGRFYLAHVDRVSDVGKWTNEIAKYIGGVGEDLEQALHNVARFADEGGNQHELIILQFSHYQNLDRQSGCDAEDLKKLVALTTRVLGARIIVSTVSDIKLDEMRLNQLAAGGRTILCVFDDSGNDMPFDITRGIYRMSGADSAPHKVTNFKIYDRYSDKAEWTAAIDGQRNEFVKFKKSAGARPGLFLLSWTATQNNMAPLTAVFGDIRGAALGANRAMLPVIDQWISDGLITADNVPNILYHDFVGVDVPSAPTELMRITERLNSLR